MKGLIAVLLLATAFAIFLLGTKIGAMQQAAAWPIKHRVVHEYRAKCINSAPTKPKKTSL